MNHKGKRPRVLIEPSDEQRLLRALEIWAHADDLVALRTRAFVLLLWDGAVRTSEALALDLERVVKDPRSRCPTVVKRIEKRPREIRHWPRSIVLSARARQAIDDYLRAARSGEWLPTGRLRGPLFLSSTPVGAGQRLSQRSAIHWWELFQKAHASDCSRRYQLDDVVYTGRMAYLEAAESDTVALSEHAGISRRWAAEYSSGPSASPEDIMAKLDNRRWLRIRLTTPRRETPPTPASDRSPRYP